MLLDSNGLYLLYEVICSIHDQSVTISKASSTGAIFSMDKLGTFHTVQQCSVPEDVVVAM